MIVVWGFKARAKAIATGTFFCPREGGDRTYEHKSAKRWFTFFWIPMIPLNDLGEFVECTSCEATYYPNVLSARTAGEIEDVTTIAIRHVVVSMLMADGQVDPAERQAALTVVSRFASHPYGAADLEDDLGALNVASLTDHLEELGAVLNEHGKESILTAAVYLAGSDGHIDEAELVVAREVGKALTMSGAHIQGTIDMELARLKSVGPQG